MIPLVGVALLAFLITDLLLRALIPLLQEAGIVGQDRNKLDQPLIPEMGGLALVGGISVGFLVVIALRTFTDALPELQLVSLTAALATILLVGLVGIVDDLVKIPQPVKALTPLLAALPLMALQVGIKMMVIPVIGPVYLGILYSLLVVPVGVTGAANAFNMLGGFNGLEAGLGLVATASLAVIAYLLNETTALYILIVAFAALLAMLRHNWYPARVFPGDAGTLSIGALIASAVIVGHFALGGLILIIPHVTDFFLKFRSRFPSEGWWGSLDREGRLHCPKARPVGLGQSIMKLCGGVRERNLVLILMACETLLGIIAIFIYWSKLYGPFAAH
jgi:UDP-N-acetylglucosamine--dolichyl-phosphate N-acetylglucosaminephosphotransferase